MMASIANEYSMTRTGSSKPSWTTIGRLPWLIQPARPEFGRAIICRSHRNSRWVQEAVNELKLRSTILDGEIVALDEEGILGFQLLQEWQKRLWANYSQPV